MVYTKGWIPEGKQQQAEKLPQADFLWNQIINIESVETTLSFAMNPVISAIKIPMTILRKYSPTMTSAPCPGKNAAVTGPKVLNNYCHGVILSRNTVQD